MATFTQDVARLVALADITMAESLSTALFALAGTPPACPGLLELGAGERWQVDCLAIALAVEVNRRMEGGGA